MRRPWTDRLFEKASWWKVVAGIVFAIWIGSAIGERGCSQPQPNETEDRRAAEERKRRAAEFNSMTPRQHWEKAQLGLRAGATLDDIDDGLRHVRAIPKSAPEAVKAKALEKKLSRAENAASAQRLIDEAFTGDPSDSWVKFRRAGVHIDAMLKQNPNDRDAPRLLREAAQKGLGMLEREGRSHPQSMQAFMACQEETEKHLKAPATADFASYSRSAVQDHGSWRYTVASYVDAQNSFGAKIRTSFRCDVQCIEAGKCDASGASARAVDSLRKQAK